MNWLKELSILEYSYMAIFMAIYIFYVIRTFFVARKFNATNRSLLIKFVIRTAYMAALMGALLGPTFGISENEARTAGKDIFLAIDISKSMDAIDIDPSRLEKIKFELTNSMEQLRNNRIGLVIFSKEAYLYTPLTYDLDALKLFIQKLNTNLISEGGTSLDAPIKLIGDKFTQNTSSKLRTKVAVLFTDGENFENLNPSNLSILKQNHIAFFVMGVGTKDGGKIKTNEGFKTDKNKQIVISRLNSSLLRKITNTALGTYFEINTKKNDMAALVNAINNVENTLLDSRKIMVANNKYYYLLLIALILMSFDIIITIRFIKL